MLSLSCCCCMPNWTPRQSPKGGEGARRRRAKGTVRADGGGVARVAYTLVHAAVIIRRIYGRRRMFDWTPTTTWPIMAP